MFSECLGNPKLTERVRWCERHGDLEIETNEDRKHS